MLKQSTSEVIMIKPVRFDYNPETAVTNAFQVKNDNSSSSQTQIRALQEFDQMVKLLQKNKIQVSIFEDTLEPHTPDSIFPNNWFSTHQDKSIFVYPMCTPNRRRERRADIIDYLVSKGFEKKNENDLSYYENEKVFLEGTGSLVLDRVNKIAFACISPRTDKKLFEEFCQKSGFKGISFVSVDKNGKQVYHTNVIMGIGEKWAYICLDSISNLQERKKVEDSLKSTGHEIIKLSLEQVENFAGNVIELENKDGQKFILISKKAFDSLTNEQKTQTEVFAKWIVPDVDTIEQNGGGSVRCMVAEVFN